MTFRSYSAVFSGQAENAEIDAFEITAPSNAQVVLEEILLGQTSDKGDAETEFLNVSLIRGYTTSGSGGSSVTPAALNPRAQAAGTSVEHTNTTVASNGSPTTLMIDTWNIQAPYIYRPPIPLPWESQEEYVLRCISIDPTEKLVCRLNGPGDALTYNATIRFAEIH